ncbi:MAG: HAD-IIA family hydrolase [Lentisphaerae bacterium]|jgi:4-nitrophenyl phosphatase|nr:HAD-IIA family hydrolase [Lentisphaerota bacterium]
MKLKGLILDLDGTVYRGSEAVPGAAEVIRDLHKRGVVIRYVTNRANRPGYVVRDQLLGMGLDCGPDDVITSSDATADYLKPGPVYVIGELGLREALDAKGFVIDEKRAEAVIVSFDREFNYAKLAVATKLISNGARFVATNPDRALRLADGIVPGTGSIVAAVAAASGVEPLIIGKPERLIFDTTLRSMGLTADEVVAVGDNLDTDIPAGAAAGIRSAFILTGISTREDLATAKVQPDWTVANYDELRVVLEGLL